MPQHAKHQNGTHVRLGENGRGEIETLYKTKSGKKLLKKRLPDGRWITLK